MEIGLAASFALPILQTLVILQGGLSLCYFPAFNAGHRSYDHLLQTASDFMHLMIKEHVFVCKLCVLCENQFELKTFKEIVQSFGECTNELSCPV